MIVTRTADKALVFFYLLHTIKVRNCLCFTKSVESAARLVMLVDAFNAEFAKQSVAGSVDQLNIAHCSSELGPGQRKEVMDAFKRGDIHMWVSTGTILANFVPRLTYHYSLVCSDLAARGLDIPTIENVVNYDVPVDMRKYVHRVGRTARAGRTGTAWSLVETQEVRTQVPIPCIYKRRYAETQGLTCAHRPSTSRLSFQKPAIWPRYAIQKSSERISNRTEMHSM